MMLRSLSLLLAVSAAAQQWCDESPPKKCAMPCDEKNACSEGECAMREGGCCDFTCRAKAKALCQHLDPPFSPQDPCADGSACDFQQDVCCEAEGVRDSGKCANFGQHASCWGGRWRVMASMPPVDWCM